MSTALNFIKTTCLGTPCRGRAWLEGSTRRRAFRLLKRTRVQILPEAALKNPFLKVAFHGDLAACEREPVCAMLALILHLATY